MATKKIDGVKPIEFGSAEHENLISGPYNMTKDEAQDILKRFEANPATVPYKEVEKARALLAALKATPIPIDTKGGHYKNKHLFSGEAGKEKE